jgi:hypothetical protein
MTTPERFEVLSGGPPADERDARLAEGADEHLRDEGRRSILGHPRFLMSVAAALMAAGLLVIVLGWVGAANSVLIEEQVPYLISGGLLGLALALIGALTLFTHWLTVSVRDARAHEAARHRDHVELMHAIRSRNEVPAPQEEPRNGRARSAAPGRPVRRARSGS